MENRELLSVLQQIVSEEHTPYLERMATALETLAAGGCAQKGREPAEAEPFSGCGAAPEEESREQKNLRLHYMRAGARRAVNLMKAFDEQVSPHVDIRIQREILRVVAEFVGHHMDNYGMSDG